MARLSKEFVEKTALEKTTIQNLQDQIERELKGLVEEIAARHAK
jgi:hypothetical protein